MFIAPQQAVWKEHRAACVSRFLLGAQYAAILATSGRGETSLVEVATECRSDNYKAIHVCMLANDFMSHDFCCVTALTVRSSLDQSLRTFRKVGQARRRKG
jgi:hypothetical protein